MSVTGTAPAFDLDLPGIRHAVDACLAGYLDRKVEAAAKHHLPPEITEVLHDFLFAGGKRLRPLLCVCAWYAAGGTDEITPVVQVAAALEMFHSFALIHDDLIDHSDTRRGQPTVHRALAALHAPARGLAAERLGTGAAILIGDLALAWSDELVHTADLSSAQLAAVLPLIDAMRTEIVYGQYLDLLATGNPTVGVAAAQRIIRYKTAKYTVERPLHIGAALAGAERGTLDALSAYALPLGEAFQLRDDLLGVFGVPGQTGKSCLDDLREGKHTVLVALALRHTSPLHPLFGHPDLDDEGAAQIRDTLTSTGARAEVEQMIQTSRDRALDALAQAGFPAAATAALRHIIEVATVRTT
jgi:geranylgeranyl diphosphate synthase type I